MNNEEVSFDRALKMEGLQDLLIDEFIQQIKAGESSPALLNAARQMLKDNGIYATVTKSSPLGELVNLLPFRDDSLDLAVGE
jgi:hypothetical protein